jgi:uncharacterized membrane protein
MPIKSILAAYLVAGATFVIIDLIWLGYVARDLYRKEMGSLLAQSFRVGPAAAFYLMYFGAIVYFAVLPALRSGYWTDALVPGALLGLVAYGTYDLTALAVVRDWPMKLSLIDMAWGTLLTAFSAGVAAYIVVR